MTGPGTPFPSPGISADMERLFLMGGETMEMR